MNTMLEPISEIKSKIIQNPLGKIRWSWQSLPLGAILLLSGFLGIWNWSINGYSNNYYAAAVKSMIQSWSNFFFVSFDPGGFVTVDKPPVAFWVQAIFAKVLGFSGFSILLPEALAGIGSVFLLYIMVKRAFGTAAGLVSALMLTITPIFVVMNRHNNPDSILVFTLMLSAWAMFRAADKGSFRWLLLAGALVGVAFNVKMLEAYVVLPAFYAMYFLLARTTWLKRIIHLAIVSVVIAVISLSWAVAVDLTPTSQRPYVDSSSVNSEIDLILNYNGLSRISGNQTSGGNNAAPSNNTADGQAQERPAFDGNTPPALPDAGNFTPPTGFAPGGQDGGAPGGGGAGFGGQAGATRLLTPQNGAEFNWFFPFAMLGMVFVGAYSFFGMAKGEERSRKLQSILLWSGWLLTFGVLFSFSKGVFHNYYLNIMAPAEAALAGIATVMLWKQYRKGGWMAYLLPLGIAATAFYQAYLLSDYTSWNWWLSPALVAVGVISLLGLVLGRVLKSERFGNRLAQVVTWVSMACLMVTPTVWSIRAVFTSITGSLPSATPSGVQGGGGNSTSSGAIPQAWLTFVGNNLSGQLILLAIVVGALLAVFGLRYLLKQQRWFNRPVISGVLLVMLLLGSTGWWINAAQAQPATNSAFSLQQIGGGGPGQEKANSALVQYLVANQGDYKYLMAVPDSNSASAYIIETGKPVMSLGGFSGSDNIVTSATQLEQMIANHTVRYFLLGGNNGRGGNTQVTQYVQQKCTAVSSSQYSGSGSNTSQSSGGGISFDGIKIMGGSEQLYVCGN